MLRQQRQKQSIDTTNRNDTTKYKVRKLRQQVLTFNLIVVYLFQRRRPILAPNGFFRVIIDSKNGFRS